MLCKKGENITVHQLQDAFFYRRTERSNFTAYQSSNRKTFRDNCSAPILPVPPNEYTYLFSTNFLS